MSRISFPCTSVTDIGFSSHLPARLSWWPCLAEQQPSPEANTPQGPCRAQQSWQRSCSTPQITFPLSRSDLSPKAAQRRQQELYILIMITSGDLAIRAKGQNGRKKSPRKRRKIKSLHLCTLNTQPSSSEAQAGGIVCPHPDPGS